MLDSNSERRVLCAAPSYAAFTAAAEEGKAVGWTVPRGGAPDVPRLLRAAQTLGGAPVQIVAIDMPVATIPIIGRRMADNLVSQHFGAAGAGTHSATLMRPGPHGKSISNAFHSAGFKLATTSHRHTPALVEVYPLAALVRLLKASMRPAYKVLNTVKYWPSKTQAERAELLKGEWATISAALKREISEIGIPHPPDWSSFAGLKGYENALDAVICAWVGSCFVEGGIEAFGDETATIWVPAIAA
jgi:predicted RNase H-like nuclease